MRATKTKIVRARPIPRAIKSDGHEFGALLMPTGHANSLLPNLRRAILVRSAVDRSDGDLLSAFVAERDADAFAVLVRRHGPMVLGVCRRVVGDLHAADDAFQAVFLVLARRAAAVHPRGQVGNWLYGVAYRTAMKARTVLARRRSREKQVDVMPEPPAPPLTDPWTDLHLVIDEELARLPDKLRLPVVLCDLEGRPQREVAKHLGIAPATLASRLATARRQLATRLGRRGIALSGGALAGLLGERASAAIVAPGLAESAVRAAEAIAAGSAPEVLTSLVSAHAVQLCEGVMRMMMLSKLKTAGATALVALILTSGIGFGLVPARAGDDPAPTPPPAATAPAPRPVAQTVTDAEFLRRLCLDLTGSLPTRVETAYFVADPAPTKREKIVEWLMADDTVKAYLAKKLGVTPDRIRLLKVIDAANGRTVKLGLIVAGRATAVRDVRGLTFSPDGKSLTIEVTPGALNLAGRATAVRDVRGLAFSPDGKSLTIEVTPGALSLGTTNANAPTGVAIVDYDGSVDLLVTTGHAHAGQLLIAGGVNSIAGVTGSIVLNERNFELSNEPARATQPAEIVYWLQPPAANTGLFNLIRRQPIVADPPVGQAPAAPAEGGGVRMWNPTNGTVKTQGQTGQTTPGEAAPQSWTLMDFLAAQNNLQAGNDFMVYNVNAVADSDEAFLRRVVEQARGGAPTALEQKYFAEDKDPKKREKLLDLLLKDPAVAKKVGDEWKKKMLENPPAPTHPTLTTWLVTGSVVTGHPNYNVTNGGTYLNVMVDPQATKAGKLVDELLAAKKTDEQMLEAITLATVGRLPTDGEKRLTLAAASKAGDRKAAWVEVAKALAGSDEAKAHAAATSPPAAPKPPVPPAKP